MISGEDSSEGSEGELLNSLERYDPSTNEWEEEAVAPTRAQVGMEVLDNKLYAAGGQDAADDDDMEDAPSNLVERYDFETKAWEAVAPMAEARSRLAVAVLDGKLYAAGGYDDDYLSSVERYDPALDAWVTVAPMLTARGDHGVAVLDGKLYAVGGYRYGAGALSSVERYDPALNAWEAVAPMAEERFMHSVAVLDGKVYAVGGFNGGILSSVERYDPGRMRGRRWRR